MCNYQIHYSVINYDESYLSDDPGYKKVIAKCTKSLEHVMNH
jgi:hypothetical protein